MPPEEERPAREPRDRAERNVEDVARLERQVVEKIPLGERVARRVTDAVGTPASALLHILVFAGWILWNTGRIPGSRPFDPYPFGFLTMFVSYEAAVVAILDKVDQKFGKP